MSNNSIASGFDEGDYNAEQNIAWQEYINEMTEIAQWSFYSVRRSIGDHDDAVMSAVRTVLRRQREENLQLPSDPDDIWPILKEHLVRKIDRYRHQVHYKKNQALRQGDLATEEQENLWRDLFMSRNQSPEAVEEYIREAMEIVKQKIHDEELQQIALKKFQGYSNEEICALLPNLSETQLSRRLTEIRRQLRKSIGAD
jgi:hypothetical protein